MPTWLEQLEQRWQHPNAPARIADLWLRPLASLYGRVITHRRAQYLSGQRPSVRLPAPTIVVGNVVVGGAGKTPVVIALTRALQQQGFTVGIISRGYGRTSKTCLEVHPTSTAAQVGDEPLLIQRATGAPVYVAPTRGGAGHALLHAYPDTDFIVCDDGLQHWALQRDCEVCIFPPWGVGNGRLLPAGPLREAWPKAVDVVIQSVNEGIPIAPLSLPSPPPPYWQLPRRLSSQVRNGLHAEMPLAALQQNGHPIVAVAGIAKPEAFFTMLRNMGVPLQQCIALPDHYAYTDLPTALQQLPANALILCTEKDAVKLWPLLPQAWAVGLEVTLPEECIATVVRVAQQRYANCLR